MDAATLIDTTTPESVLVIGSPPPTGRDLDLLVHTPAAAALPDVLAANGFRRRGRTWARFVDCGAEVVELIPAGSLDLDPEQLERLFAEAQSIAGLASLLRPAPHHRLLLLARRVAAEARLKPKQRATAAEADGDAWRTARELAPAWRATTGLVELRRALDGSPPSSWRLRSPLVRATGYQPGALIALSGLDGSGKSTQAEGLVRALSTLGYPTVAVWTTLGGNKSLDRLSAPARLLLGPSSQGPDTERPPAGEDEDRVTQLRERWPWLHAAWVNLVAGLNAWWHVRAIGPKLVRGRIVVCDRYVLDSIVQMRYRYGAKRRYRAQLGLLRLVSPKPLRAYLLDVSPTTIHARNREYTPRQIELRARLYREEYARLGVTRLDGERPQEELCAQLALEAWEALGAERDDVRPLITRILLATCRLFPHRRR
jgi:thymidylate kinase